MLKCQKWKLALGESELQEKGTPYDLSFPYIKN